MKFALFVLFFLFGMHAFADDLDPASSEALLKTQQLLTTPDIRNKALSENPNAAAVDKQVEALTGGGANREAVYSLSNSIFSDMVKNSHGDVNEMNQILLKAKDNPSEFYNQLSEENKKQLRELSEKIPGASSGPKPASLAPQ